MDVADPATGSRFQVTVDGIDLGSFTACEGLGAEYEVVEYEEGGQNAYVHRLPGRLKYTNIRLTRPVDESSARLAEWFSGLQRSVSRHTASITAYGVDHEEIASWNLVDVYPARWAGPSFSAEGGGVVKETLELVHHGFLG